MEALLTGDRSYRLLLALQLGNIIPFPNMKSVLWALALSAATSVAHAQLSYVNWTTASSNQVVGTITLPDTSVINVTYTGAYVFAQVSGGTNFWLPSTPFDALPNQPPSSDIVGLNMPGTHSLTFSSPVDGLYLLINSLGQPGRGVTYTFNQSFTVVDSGPGYWGGSVYSLSGSNSITGNEFTGVLGFSATGLTSLTWTSSPDEYWHGITAAISTGSAVPEPSTYGLFGAAALAGFVAWRRRRRA